MRLLSSFSVIVVVALALTPALHAQRPPAIQGFNGSTVTPETAKDEKKAEDKAAVAVKDAVTRQDKGPLSDLKVGMTVVVRFKSNVTEGVVSKIERATNEVSVRYENKRVETLVLADRTAKDARTVEYSDEAKQKVTRYFTPKS